MDRRDEQERFAVGLPIAVDQPRNELHARGDEFLAHPAQATGQLQRRHHLRSTTVEELQVVGQAATSQDALAQIAKAAPDVAVLDVRLPDGDGVEVCREIRSDVPGTRCLIVTAFGDDEALFAAIMAGAAGFLLKTAPVDEMIEGIRTVASGGCVVDPEVTRRIRGDGSGLFRERVRRSGDEADHCEP